MPALSGDSEKGFLYWKTACNLEGILDKSVDGRTVEGTRRRARNMQTKKDDTKHHPPHPELPLFKSYLRLADAAQSLRDMDLQTASGDDMNPLLKILHDEEVPLPVGMQQDLVLRRCQCLVESKKWAELVEVLHPFNGGEWHPFQPTLGALKSAETIKMSTFLTVIIMDGIVPMIEKGSEGAGQVSKLCLLSSEAFQTVDTVELETGTVSLLVDALAVFHALAAILQEEIDVNALDRWVKPSLGRAIWDCLTGESPL